MSKADEAGACFGGLFNIRWRDLCRWQCRPGARQLGLVLSRPRAEAGLRRTSKQTSSKPDHAVGTWPSDMAAEVDKVDSTVGCQLSVDYPAHQGSVRFDPRGQNSKTCRLKTMQLPGRLPSTLSPFGSPRHQQPPLLMAVVGTDGRIMAEG